MSDYSYVFNAHPSFVDSIYQKYLDSPESIEDGWRTFFQGFEFAKSANGSSSSATTHTGGGQSLEKEFGVLSIIHGFRNRGHLLSKTNPLRSLTGFGRYIVGILVLNTPI